jgi:hypothetical protein
MLLRAEPCRCTWTRSSRRSRFGPPSAAGLARLAADELVGPRIALVLEEGEPVLVERREPLVPRDLLEPVVVVPARFVEVESNRRWPLSGAWFAGDANG